jgi:hypothetical protein
MTSTSPPEPVEALHAPAIADKPEWNLPSIPGIPNDTITGAGTGNSYFITPRIVTNVENNTQAQKLTNSDITEQESASSSPDSPSLSDIADAQETCKRLSPLLLSLDRTTFCYARAIASMIHPRLICTGIYKRNWYSSKGDDVYSKEYNSRLFVNETIDNLISDLKILQQSLNILNKLDPTLGNMAKIKEITFHNMKLLTIKVRDAIFSELQNEHLYINNFEDMLSIQPGLTPRDIDVAANGELSVVQERPIPNIQDGMRPEARKILKSITHSDDSGTMQQNKVSKLSGYIGSKTEYHHGETDLTDAIVKMAKDYPSTQVNTNNNQSTDATSSSSTQIVRFTELISNADPITLQEVQYFSHDVLKNVIYPLRWNRLHILPMMSSPNYQTSAASCGSANGYGLKLQKLFIQPTHTPKWLCARAKVMNCNVQGRVVMSNLAMLIMDRHYFQKLDKQLQLAFCAKVYPSATHTRKAHSIGTCKLASKMIHNIRSNSAPDELKKYMEVANKRFGIGETLSDLVCELITCCGLAHDLGHGPFSHQFDGVMSAYGLTDTKKYPNIEHEYRSGEILEIILKDVLPAGHIAFMRSVIMADGEGFLYQCISNEVNGIDADKFDYLPRDAVGLGVPISFDNRRLLMDVAVVDGDVCYPYQEREQLCEMFKSRAKLFNNAYAHKSTIALNEMMNDAMRCLPKRPGKPRTSVRG